MHIIVAFALLGFCTVQLVYGGTSPKSAVASRTPAPPRIDGLLNDDVWRLAVPVEGFRQFEPEEGAPATERTVIRILYDDDALYVGASCYDSGPAGIVSQLTRRDRTTQVDRISVILDSYHDHQTAFLFGGSVSGVKTDGVLSEDGLLYDVQWDAVWDFDAQRTADGWSAEFKIPYSAIRFSDQEGEYVWGVNFRRYIARKNETDEWALARRAEVPPNTISSVSKMGHLSGIQQIRPPLHLELLPYQVSRGSYLAQPEPFPVRQEFTGTAGLDLNYGVTNNFTLSLAVNPDFGQVEVDQSVINLTVFETYYPEKRPLFLEGAQFFTFGSMFDNSQLRLLYSRRIGRQPAAPEPPPGYTFVERPKVTTILGAAKLTGKTDNGVSIGLLSAVTDRESGLAETPGGAVQEVQFASRSSYNVFRIKKDVLGNSAVGAMVGTLFNQERSPVATGGIDWSLRFDGGLYEFDGYGAGSDFTAPDGSRLSGSAGKAGFLRLPVDHWLFDATYDFSSRNFYIDDLGFYNQPREHGGNVEFGYVENSAAAPARRYVLSLSYSPRWNWDGVATMKRLEIQPQWEFRNFWALSLNYNHDFPAYDDANRGIIGVYLRPEANRLTATVSTDERATAVAMLQASYETDTHGKRLFWSTLGVTLRPAPWIELEPAYALYTLRGEEAWPVYFYTASGRNLFGDRDVDQHDISMRGTVTFTRNLSVQVFAQVLLAKGTYTNFRELIGGDELVPYAGTENPDFNEQYLNANVVLRWEYLPGSSFYLVWTQARSGYDGITSTAFGDDFSKTFRLPMDNVILAKISYWWSL